MKIEFTGRQTEVPPEVRTLAELKLQKLARVLPGITRAHVTVTADRHWQIAEASVHSKKVGLTAQSRSNDQGLRSEEHTSELQSRPHLVCRLLLEKKKITHLACSPASTLTEQDTAA